MTWTLRRAVAHDVDRLALVGAATFLETFAGILDGDAIVAHCQKEHSPAAYRRYLDDGGQAWLVEAAIGGAPVGFALVGNPNLPGASSDGTDLELKRIYTLSRFHGGGVGGALMQEAVSHAERAGFRRLLLGVYIGNARARAFYARMGFSQIGERTFRVGDRDYDDVVLARPLNAPQADRIA